ncbi:MAG: hypothetical protein AAGE85_10750 [Pseudomonadota bacterium]
MRRRLTRLVAACLTLGLLPQAAAQTGDEQGFFLAAGITRLPSADAGGITGSGAATLEGREHQLYAGGLRFSVAAMRFELGVDYQYTRYVYEDIDSRNRDLHRLQIPLHFESAVGDWRLHGHLAPGVSTSSNVFKDLFKRGSADDVVVSAGVEGRLDTGKRTWIAGVAHDRSFGRPALYPVIGVEVEPASTTRLRLAFPDSSLSIEWSDRLGFSARVFPAGHRWHVVADDFASEFDYRVEAIRAQASLGVVLWRAFRADLSLGYEFDREHALTDDLGVRLNAPLDDQWFVALGFRTGGARLPLTHGAHLPGGRSGF